MTNRLGKLARCLTAAARLYWRNNIRLFNALTRAEPLALFSVALTVYVFGVMALLRADVEAAVVLNLYAAVTLPPLGFLSMKAHQARRTREAAQWIAQRGQERPSITKPGDDAPCAPTA